MPRTDQAATIFTLTGTSNEQRAHATIQECARQRRWSGAVNRPSNALGLEQSIFQSESADQIAQSLKRSAEASTRRKSSPYQSAMSMLNFYINRAGVKVSAHTSPASSPAANSCESAQVTAVSANSAWLKHCAPRKPRVAK
jgi:hypothetical protein